jgi:acyl carrier protein
MPDRVREVVGEVFGMPAAEVPPDASPENVPAWDSLHHLELMMAIEMEFGVQVSSDAMTALLSLEAIEEYLREQGALDPA